MRSNPNGAAALATRKRVAVVDVPAYAPWLPPLAERWEWLKEAAWSHPGWAGHWAPRHRRGTAWAVAPPATTDLVRPT